MNTAIDQSVTLDPNDVLGAAAKALATPQRKRSVLAAIMGNILEWYDYAVYGYFAIVLGKTFFPAANEITMLLSTFAVFGAGFVARPIGGILIGRIGDVKGRKYALLLTMFLMAGSTVMIGFVPSYASVGLAAPLLVLFARLTQGFAAGGEWGTATAYLVEWAPSGKRGLFGSFQQCSIACGLLLGSAIAASINTVLPADVVLDWGWRIAFLFGGILGPVGLYMRRNIGETPAYEAAASTQAEAPLVSFRRAAQAFGIGIVANAAFYIFLVYTSTFTQKYAHLPASVALWSNAIGLFVMIVCAPMFGALSDRLGRKTVLIGACLGVIAIPYPLFTLMLTNPGIGTIIAVQAVFGFLMSSISGPFPAAISELFPTKTRSTWLSAGYSLSAMIFGGFAPFIATWLIALTGNAVAPAFFLFGCAAASLVLVIFMREGAHHELT